jgi:phage terminase large subunit-like protein
VHRDTGLRRFEKAYIQEGRKNGKSTEMSGVALYLMAGDHEESPQVYCAAVDKNQARIVYRAAKAMAQKSPQIRKRLRIRDYEISHISRGGQMRALSKDTKNKDGLNPSGAVVDEYHAHPTSEIYDLIWSAWGQREQALMFIITTAGRYVDNSPCFREYQFCKQILNNEITNERYFAVIRELDEGDDEHNPDNWIKANPLRASTPDGLARIQAQHDEAFDSKDPDKITTFRTKNLNIWTIGSEKSYMGEFMQNWDSLAVSREDFINLTRGKQCIVGVDLSKVIDLTADGFVFLLEDGRVAVCAQGFIPSAAIERHEKTDKVPYRFWADEKWVTVTEGEVTDYSSITTHIHDVELDNNWVVHELGYDPYNATHWANEMADEGYTCVEIRQIGRAHV